MATYIISDLHLSSYRVDLLEAFKGFVTKILNSNDQLYIIGDLFDFYVGLDKNDAAQNVVRNTLKAASARGIVIYFMQGNRDFLLNWRDAAHFYMKLLDDCHVLPTISGMTLLMHGDLLCTNDKKYMKFRRKVHNKLLQRFFRLLPLKYRLRIGEKMRKQSSQSHASYQDPKIYGVTSKAAKYYLNLYKCQNLIHGHIHQYGVHNHEAPFINTRLVLGDWDATYSFIRADLNGVALNRRELATLIDNKEILEKMRKLKARKQQR